MRSVVMCAMRVMKLMDVIVVMSTMWVMSPEGLMCVMRVMKLMNVIDVMNRCVRCIDECALKLK